MARSRANYEEHARLVRWKSEKRGGEAVEARADKRTRGDEERRWMAFTRESETEKWFGRRREETDGWMDGRG